MKKLFLATVIAISVFVGGAPLLYSMRVQDVEFEFMVNGPHKEVALRGRHSRYIYVQGKLTLPPKSPIDAYRRLALDSVTGLLHGSPNGLKLEIANDTLSPNGSYYAFVRRK
jgi:hypothetical protein